MTCEQCKFYRFVQDDRGMCQRFPPSVRNEFGMLAGFPVVIKDAWCGEFKKTPAKPK